ARLTLPGASMSIPPPETVRVLAGLAKEMSPVWAKKLAEDLPPPRAREPTVLLKTMAAWAVTLMSLLRLTACRVWVDSVWGALPPSVAAMKPFWLFRMASRVPVWPGWAVKMVMMLEG